MNTEKHKLMQRFERELSLCGQSIGQRAATFDGYVDPGVDRLWQFFWGGAKTALELAKFHPSASHLAPDLRDHFNATIDRQVERYREQG